MLTRIITLTELIEYWQAAYTIKFFRRNERQNDIILATIKQLQRLELKEVSKL